MYVYQLSNFTLVLHGRKLWKSRDGFACRVSNGHGENSGQDERELITRDEFTGVSKQGDSSRIANAIVVMPVTRLNAVVVQGCRTSVLGLQLATLTRIMTADRDTHVIHFSLALNSRVISLGYITFLACEMICKLFETL